MSRFKVVTMDDICQTLSSAEKDSYVLLVQPTNSSRLLDYLAAKLGFEKRTDVIDAVLFQTTFNSLEEARNFVAEYLSDDGHWQELALGIYFNGELIWEGIKK